MVNFLNGNFLQQKAWQQPSSLPPEHVINLSWQKALIWYSSVFHMLSNRPPLVEFGMTCSLCHVPASDAPARFKPRLIKAEAAVFISQPTSLSISEPGQPCLQRPPSLSLHQHCALLHSVVFFKVVCSTKKKTAPGPKMIPHEKCKKKTTKNIKEEGRERSLSSVSTTHWSVVKIYNPLTDLWSPHTNSVSYCWDSRPDFDTSFPALQLFPHNCCIFYRFFMAF